MTGNKEIPADLLPLGPSLGGGGSAFPLLGEGNRCARKVLHGRGRARRRHWQVLEDSRASVDIGEGSVSAAKRTLVQAEPHNVRESGEPTGFSEAVYRAKTNYTRVVLVSR